MDFKPQACYKNQKPMLFQGELGPNTSACLSARALLNPSPPPSPYNPCNPQFFPSTHLIPQKRRKSTSPCSGSLLSPALSSCFCMRFFTLGWLVVAAVCCCGTGASPAAVLPNAAVGITFDSNNIYNWSIWQFDTTISPPTHARLADIPGYHPFHPLSPLLRASSTLTSSTSTFAVFTPSTPPSSPLMAPPPAATATSSTPLTWAMPPTSAFSTSRLCSSASGPCRSYPTGLKWRVTPPRMLSPACPRLFCLSSTDFDSGATLSMSTTTKSWR
jgi:hypothetical protein